MSYSHTITLSRTPDEQLVDLERRIRTLRTGFSILNIVRHSMVRFANTQCGIVGASLSSWMYGKLGFIEMAILGAPPYLLSPFEGNPREKTCGKARDSRKGH